ncbi:MAG: MmgE/PrpD family protein [Candidatus Tectomicrobia bacterium]|uniref:MmgE/PrpD family protein n=1 Tax=Tectimicrobiota bacterium TaxID=2528274 RepID=A0A937VWA7_UNCTE|nr:MmgE/PrpD family protein [Candidatus Tectomicrobia bacterium]
MHETRTLANFVAQTHYTDLPTSVVDDCKIAVLDTLSAAFVGTAQPWAQRVVSMVRTLGGTPEATVIQQPWQTDVSRAALANGALIGAFECEPLTGSHACGTVLPAALAISQREHAHGAAFLTALAVGFEVSARIARTAVGLENVRGFHNPGTQGPFGAAMAVGKLLDFDREMLVSAMGLAGSCSAGLLEFAWSGADTKRIHLGRASQLGLESALLAQQGLHGPDTALEGRYGYFNAFSLPPQLEKLTDGLGTAWAIQPASLKSYATHVTHQAVVQAIQEFKQAQTWELAKLTRVVIRGGQRLMEERHAVRDPDTVMGGQYSLPFTTAVALTRDLFNPLLYNAEAVHDPVVRALAQRIELETIPDAPHEGPAALQAELRLEYAGQCYTLATRPHKGSPRNPFTWDEICEKFRRYTATCLPAEHVDAIITAIARLEHAPDMTAVARLVMPRNPPQD